MTNKEFIKRVSALAAPLCDENGLSLWDVTFEKEGRNHVLTVFIDKEPGVDISDCEKVSRGIDPHLDAEEYASLPSYTFSVSSAGLQRKLTRPEHFKWAEGKMVDLTFYKARDGQNALTAVLVEKTADHFVLSAQEREITIPISEVADVRLHFDF